MKKVFLMSFALIVLSTSIILFQMSSCTKAIAQKKTDTVYQTDTVYKCPNNDIVGSWKGSTTNVGGITQPFYLYIKSDSTCVSEGISQKTQENLGYGTWLLNNQKNNF